MNVLRPVVDRVSNGIDMMSEAREEIIDRHDNRPDNIILEDLVKSTAIAATLLVSAATGKNVSTIGLQDRTVKPWARKLYVALAARQVLAAGVSGMVLWRRRQEEPAMVAAYKDQASMYA